MKLSRSEDGFSLIELLAAIVILGLLSGPMVNSYVKSFQRATESHRLNRANMLARQKAEQMAGTIFYSQLSSQNKADCQLPAPYDSDAGTTKSVYDCKVKVSKVDAKQGNVELKKIEVRIIFPSPRGGLRTGQCAGTTNCAKPDIVTYVASREPKGKCV